MANAIIENRVLSEQEINDIIKLIEEGSFEDDYNIDWDGTVTYIRVNNDHDGVSAYYAFCEEGPRNPLPLLYENHKMKVGDYELEFTNEGEGRIYKLKVWKNTSYCLPDGNLQDKLTSVIQDITTREDGDYVLKFAKTEGNSICHLEISSKIEKAIPTEDMKYDLISAIKDIVSSEVDLTYDGYVQFKHDWSYDEIVEEIERQLSAEEYVEVDRSIYPADDWDDVVESLFDGEEPGEDDYIRMTKHEVAVDLADNIDCGW